MNADAQKIIKDFLHLSGEKKAEDFRKIIQRIAENNLKNPHDNEALIKLTYVFNKVERGMRLAMQYGSIYAIIDDTEEDIEKYFEKRLPDVEDLGKIKMPKKVRERKNTGTKQLGKLVDEGQVPTSKSRADNYWNDRVKVIFTPTNKALRTGAEIPKSYDYDNLDFLVSHYNLRAIEFGNWLSQQDRKNYLAALGLSLFDLHKILGFNPKDISLKKKITVAFGARGRGSALAHFESDTFAINITRYERPKKGSTLKKDFDRTKLLTLSGGMGSFAHEYGHALDYYAGSFIEPNKTRAVSDARSLRTITRKLVVNKPTVTGLMEKILDKIIWEKKDKQTSYYKKLVKLSELKGSGITDYYLRRNELFARAFEVYVHAKMQKKKHKNIFLAETKYQSVVYLTLIELRRIEKDMDALMSAIKRKL